MSLERDLERTIRDAYVSGEITEIYADLDKLVELIVMVVSAHEKEPTIDYTSWISEDGDVLLL